MTMVDDKQPIATIGDIRHTYPVGTPLYQILVFEIWDGEKWVKNTEQPNYQVQLSPDHGT